MNAGLIALEVAARINRIDLDLRAISREFGIHDEVSPEELLRIARRFGFRARLKRLPVAKIVGAYPLPAISVENDGVYRVLLKAKEDGSRLLLFDPESQKTDEASLDDVDAAAEVFIILSHRKISARTVFGFRWFLAEMVKFKRIIGEVLVGSFVVQLFGLVTPLFTQVILDKVIVHRSLTTLDVLAIAFLAVTVFELLLNIARNYIFIHTANKLDAKLGAKLFRHLLSLPFMYFESRKVGNIAARVRELDTIREFITNKAVSVIIDLFFSLVFVAVMLLYSVELTLIVLGFVTVIALIYLVITPELRRRLEEKFQMTAASNSYLVESVTGMQTVKSLAVEGRMQKRWEDHLGRYVRSSFSLANMSNIFGAISGTVRRLMTIAILFIGVKSVLTGDLTIGQLIAFQMFAGQFAAPVLRLVNLWHEFQQALLSVDRLGDILNHPPEVSTEKAITLPKLGGALRLENVIFSYMPGGPRVIDGISFSVKPGTSVGIVGRSGSGKSTLAKLLQRLYLPTEGAIYIDGVDVRHMNPYWLRYNIGVVLQENYLFSGTIRENIALARPDAPMEAVLKTSQIAGAHEFINQLPEGYDTQVGERGSALSGGQRQRVAIARALISDPRLLIFDEATSALDYESERIVRENMKAISRGRTTLIIAHRLSTIRNCDMIMVMEKGKIVEAGRQEELMAREQGYFRHMHQLQA
ncbi:MAG: type I secretion system permease/ATPase [Desulfobacterales bacterium]|nr:type I secretion system permease/ATPase [Desulfobacterales bacterium]